MLNLMLLFSVPGSDKSCNLCQTQCFVSMANLMLLFSVSDLTNPVICVKRGFLSLWLIWCCCSLRQVLNCVLHVRNYILVLCFRLWCSLRSSEVLLCSTPAIVVLRVRNLTVLLPMSDLMCCCTIFFFCVSDLMCCSTILFFCVSDLMCCSTILFFCAADLMVLFYNIVLLCVRPDVLFYNTVLLFVRPDVLFYSTVLLCVRPDMLFYTTVVLYVRPDGTSRKQTASHAAGEPTEGGRRYVEYKQYKKLHSSTIKHILCSAYLSFAEKISTFGSLHRNWFNPSYSSDSEGCASRLAHFCKIWG